MTNDKQRERLVELLEEASAEAGKYFRETTKKVLAEKGRFSSKEDIDRKNIYEIEADYLLANGVIAQPCKVGQELWDIHYNKPRKWEVVYLGYNGEEWHINIHWWKDRHNFKTMSITYPFVGKMWYLTKEEAEEALKGGVQG